MNTYRKRQIEELATSAREEVIEHKIIKEKIENVTELEKIVKYFGGVLHEDKIIDSQIKRTGITSFEIYTNTNKPINIIQYLGKALLNLRDIKLGDTINAEGFTQADIEAAFFAREFLMPRGLFERVLIHHLDYDTFDVKAVAEELNVDYKDILIRGKELYIFRS